MVDPDEVAIRVFEAHLKAVGLCIDNRIDLPVRVIEIAASGEPLHPVGPPVGEAPMVGAQPALVAGEIEVAPNGTPDAVTP
jgi:hypothetical protein